MRFFYFISHHCIKRRLICIVLKDIDANRIVELREELETMDAEKQVYTQSTFKVDDAKNDDFFSMSVIREIIDGFTRNQLSTETFSEEKGIYGALYYLLWTNLDSKLRHVYPFVI